MDMAVQVGGRLVEAHLNHVPRTTPVKSSMDFDNIRHSIIKGLAAGMLLMT